MSDLVYTYRTLRTESSGKYQEKSSKFIAVAFPMSQLSDMESMLSRLKTEHPKARHWCYAYRILDGDEITEYASDAGEPSGSAGKPILNALLSADVLNTGAIVVRYFGGTKLGVPGLIHAYRTATEDALHQAPLYTHVRSVTYQVDSPLGLQPLLLEYSKNLGIQTDQYSYDSRFHMVIHVPLESHESSLLLLLRSIAKTDYGDVEKLLKKLDMHLSRVN